MKKILYYTTLISLLSMHLSCSNDDNKINPYDEFNTNLTCVSAQEVGNYSTFYKPQFGQVGDPMPFYSAKDKAYYMFFLYENANNHPIFYTKTNDFANYDGFTEAIPNGKEGSVDEWIGTGSFIQKGDTYYCFYTGNPTTEAKQLILLATSTDLSSWTKQSSFVMVAPADYDKANFRDPAVYFDTELSKYIMLVASRKDNKGIIARYQSSDLLSWELIAPLENLSADDVEIFECPDIFQMGNKWYLVYSRINRDQQRKTFYRIADSSQGPWKQYKSTTGEVQDTFDNLYFYAGKTVSDGTSRFISAWASTGQTVNHNNELDWAGALITHQLVQEPDGRLTTVIPAAIKTKLNKEVSNTVLKTEGVITENSQNFKVGSEGVNSYVVFPRFRETTRLVVSMQPGTTKNKFGLAFGACDKQEDLYKINFDLTTDNKYHLPQITLTYNDDELTSSPMLLKNYDTLHLEIIIEKSVLTLYVNDQVAFSARLYKMNKNPWMIFSENGEVSFTNIKKYTSN